MFELLDNELLFGNGVFDKITDRQNAYYPTVVDHGKVPRALIGQVPALVEHFFDIDVTKFQR